MRIRHQLAAAAVSMIATLALAGPAAAATRTVQATDQNGGPPFRFSPSTITIRAGDSVTWTNTGTVPHTATGSSFDTGPLSPGQSSTHTFSAPGTYSYRCQFHGSLGMVGTVVVEAVGTPPPTTPPGGTTAPPAGGGGTSSLPNTGSGSSTVPFLATGAALVLGGAVVLLALRRARG